MADYGNLVNSGGTIFNQGAKVAYSSADQLAADLGISSGAIQWGNIAKAGVDFNPAGYTGYTAPGAVSLNQMQPQAPVVVPTPTLNITTSQALDASNVQTSKSLDSYIQALNTPTPTQDQASDLSKQIYDLLGQTAGQTQNEAQQEEALGISNLKKQLSDINGQILINTAEYNKILTDYQAAEQELRNQPQQLAGVTGSKSQELQRSQAISLNQKASEGQILAAKAQAMQGNIEASIEQAQKATEIAYAPILEQLNIKKQQLEVIQPILNEEEKRKANTLSLQYEQQQQEVENQKQQFQNYSKLAIGAGIVTPYTNFGGTIVNTFTGEAYPDEQSFFKSSGVTSFEQANARNLITDYDSATQQQIQSSKSLPRSNSSNTDLKSTADTSGEIKSWIIANKRANSYIPYYELWGQLADELKKEGLNPENYDKVFWEILHPEGLVGYEAEQKKKKGTSTNTSGGINFDDL
jgi:hypothetical protein